MTAAQIENTYKSGLDHLLSGRLKLAFDKIGLLIEELQWGEWKDQFNELRQNYRYLLQFFGTGGKDPERKIIYNKLVARLIDLNNRLHEELMMRNSTVYEYTQKRYFPHKLHFRTSADMFDSMLYYHNQSALLTSEHESELKRLRQNFENLIPDLFYIYWLSARFETVEKQVYKQLLDPSYPGTTEKNLLVSALTLNLWRMFDEEKLYLLLDACENKDIQVRQRALVGLCFILTRYNSFLAYFPGIRNRLVLLADNSQHQENLKNIIILIIGTMETERITKKMKEEILPEVMKITPMIKDRLDAESLMKSEDWEEENPEWTEMLEQSGVADKLQELTEMQLEGADVYMSTFSLLKNFPFFNETANWFLPFDPEFTDISELFRNKDHSVMSAFLGNSAICNSDKYSFCLSVLQMPLGQRDSITRTFRAEADQLNEITKDELLLNPDQAARNIARQYIQDLYRFFRVHPQHSDFVDMFTLSLNIHRSSFFEILSVDPSLKIQTAEYYFNKGHYLESIELFTDIINSEQPSAALYQKIGFAYQKNSQITKALDAYIKADVIQPDDLWTVKKISLCYRLLGKFDKALDNYRHADYLQPNKFNVKMQIANCLIALDRHAEALKLYADLEEVAPENEILWRATSWCAFVSGNLHQADYYIEKLLSSFPNASDYLNAGHIAFCKNDIPAAITHYQTSMKLQNNRLKQIVDQINGDSDYLIRNGLDLDDVRLLIDELYFQSE